MMRTRKAIRTACSKARARLCLTASTRCVPLAPRRTEGVMESLTPGQAAVLLWIQKYIDENASSPSQDDIARAFGISKIGAVYYVNLLERKGFIRRLGHYKHRSLEMTGRYRVVPISGEWDGG